MKKLKLLCSGIILSGILLFVLSCFLFSSPLYNWCIGLACALIVLGLGYLANAFLLSAGTMNSSRKHALCEEEDTSIKEKAGYLVCKCMNVILCIYLYILNELGCETRPMLLGISLVLLQFLLDLLIQLFLIRRSYKKEP